MNEYSTGSEERFKKDKFSYPISLVKSRYPIRFISSAEKRKIKEMTEKWTGISFSNKEEEKMKNESVKTWYYVRTNFNTWDTDNKKTKFGPSGTENLLKTLIKGYEIFLTDKTKDVMVVKGDHDGWSFNYTKLKMIPPGHLHNERSWYDISFEYDIFDLEKNFPHQKGITLLSEPDESLLKPLSNRYTETLIESHSAEYDYLVDFFNKHQYTIHNAPINTTSNRMSLKQYKIDSIKKISDTIHARKYHFQRSVMENPTEMLLFYRSLDTRNKELLSGFGSAIYVSDNVNFSYSYSNKNQICLVKCLVGNPDTQDSNPQVLIRPPMGFDSVTYTKNNTNVFVMYSNDQCYMSYILDISKIV